MPTQVYTNLIETVHNNMDAMYKYVALRKELLDVDELRFSDLYVPIVDDVELTFTYEEACDIILEALRPMGEKLPGLGAPWPFLSVGSTYTKRRVNVVAPTLPAATACTR